MSIENLGNPLTDIYSIPGGQARLYQHGMTVKGAEGEVVVSFDFPMIGRPNIVTGNAPPFEPNVIIFQLGKWQLDLLTSLLQAALAGRLSLMPTGPGAVQVLLTLGPAQVAEPEQKLPGGIVIPAVYRISINPADLFDRTLYDVAILADDGKWRIVAPHAVYHRRTWTDFGIASINDLHVARRIDGFREILMKAGETEGAQRLINWNDRFRGFVKYANYLHHIGVLDIILAIGDVYDYIYEDDDNPEDGGNAKFLRNLILGKAPGPDFPDVEELLVPIFMVPGNHDYRKHPYKLLFFIEAYVVVREGMEQYSGYNIGNREARVIEAKGVELPPPFSGYGVPTVSADEAAKMVEVDPELKAYRTFLADRLSYVLRLGDHRIAMLDSGPDKDVVTSPWEFIKDWLGADKFSEDEASFIDGSPNSEGISERDLERVSQHLATMPDSGLFIVGVHAPLFNTWKSEYPYFLRETQRPALPTQTHGFLARHSKTTLSRADLRVEAGVEARHPLWFPDERDHRSPKFVKRGDSQDLLDYDVSRGQADDLMRLLAGAGSRPPADLVLSGHTHNYNEFKVRSDVRTGELAYYMDFYTENPERYYPARFTKSLAAVPEDFPNNTRFVVLPTTDVTYVDIVPGAAPDATPSPVPEDTTSTYKYELKVPPYPNTLSSALDPRTWWAEHRPLVLQTGALGPCKKLTGPDKKLIGRFEGFRVLSVKGDVIDKIHFVSMKELEANQFRLEWKQEPKWLEPVLQVMMG